MQIHYNAITPRQKVAVGGWGMPVYSTISISDAHWVAKQMGETQRRVLSTREEQAEVKAGDEDLSGSPGARSSPANAGDMGSIPGPEGFHMPRGK